MSNSDPVTIATFPDFLLAEFAQSVLEGSGIESFIQQPFTASIAPHYMRGAGVQLIVAGADAERALEVLASAQDFDVPDSEG